MVFQNEKKTFLAKLDKSKKGQIDLKVIPLISLINSKAGYYTTSSCSGRVYFWQGTGKKNQTEWLKISHDLVNEDFFELEQSQKTGWVWLRLEPFIIHIACQDLVHADKLLETARTIYKKSCLLSVSNKTVVEIRGSELIEMPFYSNHKLLFSGDLTELKELINRKMEKIWQGLDRFVELLRLS